MLLRMNNISKLYGSLLANDNVSLHLEKGEILAIAGENGAGKTTIMKILYGLEQPTKGEIFINEKKVSIRSPQDAIKHKIGMVQQHFMLFAPFTAAENIVYSKEPRKGKFFFDINRANKEVEELSKKYGLAIDPTVKVVDCPVGIQQRIEILKILYQEAEILIFDEPSAVLTPQEVRGLLSTLKNLREHGKSIILITHKLQEVMDVADRVMIMRNGRYVKDMPVKETSIKEMSFLMVGHDIPQPEVKPSTPGETALEIENLKYTQSNGKPVLDGLSMHVDQGEIVGIAGVSGNGQSELVQCITGRIHYGSGIIRINGTNIKKKSVKEIREIGCACIPEDRFKDGCAKEATIAETVLMAHHSRPEFNKRGILKKRNNDRWSADLLRRFDVRYSSLGQKTRELSGGNLQKLIVAREIAHESKFMIADEPTRGVDIGAMMFIHEKLMEKRDKGDAILLVSSELSEIIGLSDRIYVIFKGQMVGEFTRETANIEQIGLLMLGGKANG